MHAPGHAAAAGEDGEGRLFRLFWARGVPRKADDAAAVLHWRFGGGMGGGAGTGPGARRGQSSVLTLTGGVQERALQVDAAAHCASLGPFGLPCVCNGQGRELPCARQASGRGGRGIRPPCVHACVVDGGVKKWAVGLLGGAIRPPARMLPACLPARLSLRQQESHTSSLVSVNRACPPHGGGV